MFNKLLQKSTEIKIYCNTFYYAIEIATKTSTEFVRSNLVKPIDFKNFTIIGGFYVSNTFAKLCNENTLYGLAKTKFENLDVKFTGVGEKFCLDNKFFIDLKGKWVNYGEPKKYAGNLFESRSAEISIEFKKQELVQLHPKDIVIAGNKRFELPPCFVYTYNINSGLTVIKLER